jgi:hypothetical protein
MQTKKIAVVFLIIAVAIGGFVTGLYLLRQRQDIREKAAVPGGQAKVSISPDSGEYNVGDTINTSISFNTDGVPVSGIAVRLSYPYSGSTPEVSVSGIRVASGLLSSGNWACPTQNASQQGGNVVIDIACANTSATGFSSSSDTLLANVDLKINRATSGALEVKFDPASSVVTRKTDNQDILLIPTSTGMYTIAGASASTPTPTTKAGTPTPTTKVTATATVTPTKKVTSTPTPTKVSGTGGTSEEPTEAPTATMTPTPRPTSAELPDAGVSFPTVMGIGLGALVLMGAAFLAL